MHTKAAANKQLPALKIKTGNQNAYVTRVNEENLSEVSELIQKLINQLQIAGLIKNYPPCFNLGSTRLIGDKLGGWVYPDHPYETREVYNKALTKKKTFGDIDIDCIFIKPIKDLANFFNSLSTCTCKISGKEINTSHLISNNQVIQLDFVNVEDNRSGIEFSQFSSFLDMNEGLKGLLRDVICRSTAKVTKIDQDTIDILQTYINRYFGMIKEGCSFRDGEEILYDRVRWSLTHSGLKLLVIFRKRSKEKVLKTEYKIEATKLMRKMFDNDEELETFIPFTDLDRIAQFLGFTEGSVLKHSVLMLKQIEGFDLDTRQAIWNEIVTVLNSKLPTETAGGQLSREEYDHHINYMKPYFKGIVYEVNV